MSDRSVNKRRIKAVLILSFFCFAAAILAVAYHHHDTSFLLRSCAICNVKSSLSGLSNINKTDAVSALAVPAFAFVPILIFICCIDCGTSTPALGRFTAFHPNRAPPVF